MAKTNRPGDERLPDRFWAKVRPSRDTKCWIWTGKGTGGYGQFWDPPSKKYRSAHRVAYEALVGAIPPNLEIDHLCRRASCVNPFHMEAVSHRDNMRRSPIVMGAFRRRAADQRIVTHCPRGHAYQGSNLVIEGGRRRCRECRRLKGLRYYERHAEQLRASSLRYTDQHRDERRAYWREYHTEHRDAKNARRRAAYNKRRGREPL